MTDLHERAAALLAAADKMTPEEWRAVGTSLWGDFGCIAVGLSSSANSSGIVALRNEAPALIRELLAENERMRQPVTINMPWNDELPVIKLFAGDDLDLLAPDYERLRARVAELEAEIQNIVDAGKGPDLTTAVDAGPTEFRGRKTRRKE